MTEEKKEKSLFNIKWKHIKIVVPIVVSVLCSTFTFGYFVQNEVNKVATARLQLEVDKLKSDMKKNEGDVSDVTKQIKILKSNLLFFKIDRNYYQAYSDFKKDNSTDNLKKFILAKKRYVKYLQYRRKLLKELKNGSESDEIFNELSETAIFIDGNWYKIPYDVLIELN